MRKDHKKRGSMTIVMCLMLSVMMGLITAGIKLGREEYAGVQAAAAADTAVYSLFAGYDRDLLEEYDLFFLDGGFGEGEIRPDAMIEEMDRTVKGILEEGVPGCRGAVCGISGYHLATEGEGDAFCRQAAESVKHFMGPEWIRKAEEQMKSWNKTVRGQKERSEGGPLQTEPSEEEEKAVRETMTKEENPAEAVKALKKTGILELVLPKDRELSGKEADTDAFLTERTLQQGRGGTESAGSGNKMLLQCYIMEKMPSFADRSGGRVLDYQAEYILNGENTDKENLKKTIYKLLALRETANLTFLYTDPARRMKAKTVAGALGTMFLVPEFIPLLDGFLMTGWAYVESLSDVRILLAGGRVPLMKTEEAWRSDLMDLPAVLTGEDPESGRGTGMDYEDYLMFLMGLKGKKILAFRCMDLIEQNIRLHPGREAFRMDSCIESIEAEMIFTGPFGKTRTAVRKYSYNM